MLIAEYLVTTFLVNYLLSCVLCFATGHLLRNILTVPFFTETLPQRLPSIPLWSCPLTRPKAPTIGHNLACPDK